MIAHNATMARIAVIVVFVIVAVIIVGTWAWSFARMLVKLRGPEKRGKK